VTLLSFKAKYVVQDSTHSDTNTTSTLANDTHATQTFTLTATQTVLAIYSENSANGDPDSGGTGKKIAINVDSTDYSQVADSPYGINYPVGNCTFWVGSLAAGSHTITGRFATNTTATSTISNRTLLIYIFDGNEFTYITNATEQTTTSTTFVDDNYATTTFTPSGACVGLYLYVVSNDHLTTNSGGHKIAISVAGSDYAQAEKSPDTTDYADSVFTCYSSALTAVSTVVKGREADNLNTTKVSRRHLAVLLLSNTTLMDIVTSITQVTTTSNTLVDDAQVAITRTTTDSRELLVIGMGTKRHNTTSTNYGESYGLMVNAVDVAQSRRSCAGAAFADSAATCWAGIVAAGAQSVKGRLSTNLTTNTAKIDARIVVALWFAAMSDLTASASTSVGTVISTIHAVHSSGAWLTGYTYRTFVPYTPPAKWVSGHVYSLSDVCVPITRNGYIYVCTTAGTAGAGPTWGTVLRGVTSDGATVKWTCISTDSYTVPILIDNYTHANTTSIPNWSANQTWAQGDVCRPTTHNGYIYVCSTGGAGGASEPSPWGTTIAGTTADNSATWTCIVHDNTALTNYIHCNGHNTSLTTDIRFTQGDGTTAYDYYRESATGPWWVEVIAHPDYSAYAYYGKTGDSDGSNGANSFLFFDDFESGNLNNWDVKASTSIVTSGQYEGNDAALTATGTKSFGKTQNIGQCLIRTAAKTSAVAARRSSLLRLDGVTGGGNNVYALCYYNGAYQYYPGATAYLALPTATTYAADTYDIQETALDCTNSLFRWWINGASKGTATLKDSSNYTELPADYFDIIPRLTTASATETITVDQVWVRNYIYPESAWSIVYSEESRFYDIGPDVSTAVGSVISSIHAAGIGGTYDIGPAISTSVSSVVSTSRGILKETVTSVSGVGSYSGAEHALHENASTITVIGVVTPSQKSKLRQNTSSVTLVGASLPFARALHDSGISSVTLVGTSIAIEAAIFREPAGAITGVCSSLGSSRALHDSGISSLTLIGTVPDSIRGIIRGNMATQIAVSAVVSNPCLDANGIKAKLRGNQAAQVTGSASLTVPLSATTPYALHKGGTTSGCSISGTLLAPNTTGIKSTLRGTNAIASTILAVLLSSTAPYALHKGGTTTGCSVVSTIPLSTTTPYALHKGGTTTGCSVVSNTVVPNTTGIKAKLRGNMAVQITESAITLLSNPTTVESTHDSGVSIVSLIAKATISRSPIILREPVGSITLISTSTGSIHSSEEDIGSQVTAVTNVLTTLKTLHRSGASISMGVGSETVSTIKELHETGSVITVICSVIADTIVEEETHEEPTLSSTAIGTCSASMRANSRKSIVVTATGTFNNNTTLNALHDSGTSISEVISSVVDRSQALHEANSSLTAVGFSSDVLRSLHESGLSTILSLCDVLALLEEPAYEEPISSSTLVGSCIAFLRENSRQSATIASVETVSGRLEALHDSGTSYLTLVCVVPGTTSYLIHEAELACSTSVGVAVIPAELSLHESLGSLSSLVGLCSTFLRENSEQTTKITLIGGSADKLEAAHESSGSATLVGSLVPILVSGGEEISHLTAIGSVAATLKTNHESLSSASTSICEVSDVLKTTFEPHVVITGIGVFPASTLEDEKHVAYKFSSDPVTLISTIKDLVEQSLCEFTIPSTLSACNVVISSKGNREFNSITSVVCVPEVTMLSLHNNRAVLLEMTTVSVSILESNRQIISTESIATTHMAIGTITTVLHNERSNSQLTGFAIFSYAYPPEQSALTLVTRFETTLRAIHETSTCTPATLQVGSLIKSIYDFQSLGITLSARLTNRLVESLKEFEADVSCSGDLHNSMARLTLNWYATEIALYGYSKALCSNARRSGKTEIPSTCTSIDYLESLKECIDCLSAVSGIITDVQKNAIREIYSLSWATTAGRFDKRTSKELATTIIALVGLQTYINEISSLPAEMLVTFASFHINNSLGLAGVSAESRAEMITKLKYIQSFHSDIYNVEVDSLVIGNITTGSRVGKGISGKSGTGHGISGSSKIRKNVRV